MTSTDKHGDSWVHKCPYLKCKEIFFSRQDWKDHQAQKHGVAKYILDTNNLPNVTEHEAAEFRKEEEKREEEYIKNNPDSKAAIAYRERMERRQHKPSMATA